MMPIAFQGKKSRSHLHMLNTVTVIKPCKQDKDRIIWAKIVRLDSHTCYGKMETSIAFQSRGEGGGSKVKVTC